jgi:DNA repair ATPase RecN
MSMALKRIVLRDFVIVEELDLDLSGGFTVLTGETGAGKSILIDAVQLVTGARADAGTIREGAGRAEVTAEANRKPLTLGNICLKTNRNGASQMAGTREAKKKIGLIQHLIAQA